MKRLAPIICALASAAASPALAQSPEDLIAVRLTDAIRPCWVFPEGMSNQIAVLSLELDATGQLLGTPQIVEDSPLAVTAVRALVRCSPYSFVAEIAKSPDQTFPVQVMFRP